MLVHELVQDTGEVGVVQIQGQGERGMGRGRNSNSVSVARLPLAPCPLLLDKVLQHHPHIPRRALQMGLGNQLAGAETEGLFEAAKLFVAGRIGDAAGLDQREIRLGDTGLSGQLIEGQSKPASLAAKFGAQCFHQPCFHGLMHIT